MSKNTAKSNEKNTSAPAEQEQTSTELSNVETQTALAVPEIDFAADASEFQSGFTREDFQMPFLQVIQSNSPQVTEGHAKYIEEAKAGRILETATNTVYDVKKTPLRIIVVSYRKTFVEWVRRDEGGGFVKDHGVVDGALLLAKCTKDDRGRQIVPGTDGKNQLVETMQYVVLFESNTGDWKPAVLSLTSTQLKKGRTLNSILDGLKITVAGGRKVTPPFFYTVFTVTTLPESNDLGNWQGLKIDSSLRTVDLEDGGSIYIMARELRKSIDSGAVDMSKAAAAEGSGEPAAPSTDGGYDAGSHNAF